MSELGGPTTQSGIFYQNTIAALYLGRLCDNATLPPALQISEVRCEAPTKVDDIVLTFYDGHHEFIQAKENLEVGGKAWEALWRDFSHQYKEQDLQSGIDQLTLFVGEQRIEYRALREMTERAHGSTSLIEWKSRLNKAQLLSYEKIKILLDDSGLDEAEHHSLFACIKIHQEALEDLELRAYREMPSCSTQPISLFRLLRDRVGSYARLRKVFRADDLIASLYSEHGITFATPAATPMCQTQPNPLTFVPGDHSSLQWFVSSRLQNDCLKTERDAVVETINGTDMIVPWVWEQMPAGTYSYQETCLHHAASSDGLVLILANELSPFCLKEYEAATAAKKPCFIFVKASGADKPSLTAFLNAQRARGSNPVRFGSTEELKSHLSRSLKDACVRSIRHSHYVLLTQTSDQVRMQ